MTIGPKARRHTLELAVIILCLGGEVTEGEQAFLRRVLAGSLDWDYIIAKSLQERVTTTMYTSLIAFGHGGSIPPSALKSLEFGNQLNRARNHWIFEDTSRFVAALDREGIRSVLLKGVALANYVYNGPDMRIMTDADVLVEKEAANDAREILLELDYRPVEHDPPPNHHLVPFLTPNNVLIEVHWDLVPHPHPFKLGHPSFWPRTQNVDFAGTPSEILAAEDFLCHVIVHGSFQHAFRPALRLAADVTALLHKFGRDLSAEGIRKRAKELSVWPYVAAVLYLVASLAGKSILGCSPEHPPKELIRMLKHGPAVNGDWHVLKAIRSKVLPALDFSPYTGYERDYLDDLFSTGQAVRNEMMKSGRLDTESDQPAERAEPFSVACEAAHTGRDQV